MQKQDKKSVWMFPWGFVESSIIVTSLMVSGFLIDLFSVKRTEIEFTYPVNIIILCFLFVVLIAVFFIFKKSYFVKWLQSAKLSIVTICWMLFLVLIMGMFKQENSTEQSVVNSLYLNNILLSSAFFILQLILLMNLSFAIINRLYKFNFRNFTFILNHLGVLIIIIGLGFGSGDISKYTLRISKNDFTWKTKQDKKEIDLPFAFKLIDFNLENFPTKIGIIDNETDEVIKGNDKIILIGQDSVMLFDGKIIRLKKDLKNSVQFGESFHAVNESGSCASAYIEIEYKNGEKHAAWVSRGSYLYPSVLLPIDSNYTLAMLEPEAKNYKSEIGVYFKNGDNQQYTIEVNKPVNVDGWDIYQVDYNQELGEWSDYSVIEMVNDPWLNVIYFGIFLLLVGVVLLIFTGRINKNELV